MATRTVSVKLTETEFKALRQLRLFKQLKSDSDVLRQALMALAKSNNLKPEVEKQIKYERFRHYPRKRRLADPPQ